MKSNHSSVSSKATRSSLLGYQKQFQYSANVSHVVSAAQLLLQEAGGALHREAHHHVGVERPHLEDADGEQVSALVERIRVTLRRKFQRLTPRFNQTLRVCELTSIRQC